ncbi:MAG: SAM-dependent methyltransferase [Rubrivivax sp.]
MSESPPAPAAVERFFAACETSLQQQRFDKLVLAGYRGPEADLQRLSVRAIVLRGQPQLSFVFSHSQRDITRNWPLTDGLAELRRLVGIEFANAHLHTLDEELQLACSRKGRFSLSSTARDVPATDAPAPAHNRDKQRLLSLDRPFLQALGVTDAQQRLVPAMARKWKQINKFLEVFDGALAATARSQPPQALRVLDYGSGKGYLSFALHEHLQNAHGLTAQVIGIELRLDMVQLCNGIVQQLGLQGLHFEQGDVASFDAGRLDVMIALHACDTATDHAIHRGIRGGAQIILCAPCCHKQLRPQLLSPHPLRPMLQHGVHLGQQADMLTDALRALLLDACGYSTQVFEFVSLEHTAKNKMILATRRRQPTDAQPVLAQVDALKAFYGIRDQCLETLLKADAVV